MARVITHPRQISEIVRARRRASGLSQAELATKLGLSQNRLSEVEADPSQLKVGRLIEILNLLGLRMNIELRTSDTSVDEW